MASPTPSPQRAPALAMLAGGATVKQVLAQLPGLKENTLRSWKADRERAARQAQQAGLQGAMQAASAAAGQKGESAGTPPALDASAPARKKALRILERAAAGHKFPEFQINAAKSLLVATKTAGGRTPDSGPDESAESFKAMHEAELVERMIVTACTLWGVERVTQRLKALSEQGQADAGGQHYPMPTLLGGKESRQDAPQATITEPPLSAPTPDSEAAIRADETETGTQGLAQTLSTIPATDRA